MEILLMCSLLCSTDVVAAISIVKYEKQPKLFSLIFGEGILNDAVCIILFDTVMEYSGPHSEFTAITPFHIVGGFLKLSFLSVFVGFVIGIISSVVFANYRNLTHSSIIECSLVFCFGYLSYSVSELIHCSGIIALLTCGVIMAHYTWYNLSPQAKQVTSVSFQVIGYVVEAFVFSYLGLTFFSYYETFDWSMELIIAETVIVVFGRLFGTFGIIKFLE